jgi:hypothetical protein
MFNAFFNIFTDKDNVRIEGSMWLIVNMDGSGDVNVILTSPYSGIATSAAIKNDKIEFSGMVIDPVKDDFTDYILKYLYSAYKSFQDNLPHIQRRYLHYINTEKYENYCANLDIKKEIENKINEQYDFIYNDGINHQTPGILQLEEKLEDLTHKIDNHRFTMIKEITAINGINIDDDLIMQIFDKYFDV